MLCDVRGRSAAQTGGMKRSFGAGGKFMAIYKKYLISDIFAWIYQFFLIRVQKSRFRTRNMHFATLRVRKA